MDWKFLNIYSGTDYSITRAVSNWGAACSAATNPDGPRGFQFLAKGSVRVLDRNGDFYRDYVAGEQLTAPPDASPWAMESVILVAKEQCDYFCIQSAQFPNEALNGTIHQLSAGETFSIENKNILVASGLLSNKYYPREVFMNHTETFEVTENSMVVEFI